MTEKQQILHRISNIWRCWQTC